MEKMEFQLSDTKILRKRTRTDDKVVEKRGCEEDLSWWTRLMLGMCPNSSSLQPIHKTYPSTAPTALNSNKEL